MDDNDKPLPLHPINLFNYLWCVRPSTIKILEIGFKSTMIQELVMLLKYFFQGLKTNHIFQIKIEKK
jgi:hypothetical protein